LSDDWQTIVDVEASAGETERLGESVRLWLLDEGIISADVRTPPEGVTFLPGPRFTRAIGPEYATSEGIDGVIVEAGRRVFDSGGNGIELTCASCGSTFAVDFHGDAAWTEAVEAWQAGADDAQFACPSCGTPRRLVEWRGPRPWAFGHLGIAFWNWPPLLDEFVDAVAARLGHQIVLVRCHV